MVSIELIIVLLVAAVMIFLNALPNGYLVSSLVLLTLFLFQAANISATMGIFYTMMAVAVVIFAMLKIGAKDVDSVTFLGTGFKGAKYSVLVVIIAVIIYGLMRTLQANAASQILGIPPVLAAGEVLSVMSPMYVSVLGYVETRFFIGLFDLLRKYVAPSIIPTFPGIVAGVFVMFIFGVFHISAFSLSWSVMIFAMIAMGIWLLVAESPLGEEPASLSHYFWNAMVSLGQVLKVIT